MTANMPLPPMGWYPTRDSELRWWDGRKWTGMRVRNGRPGIDQFTTEQPGLALGFGCFFTAIALFQILILILIPASPAGVLSASTTFLLAALWFALAAHGAALKRLPVPAVAPVAPDVIRPLPWEQEGPGAGWHPVSRQLSRWWTGARWTQYTASRFGVRPTFHGEHSLRIYRILTWVLIAIGAAGLVVGILIVALLDRIVGSGFIGAIVLFAGVVLALVGVLLLTMTGVQRRALLPPASPPFGIAPADSRESV